MTESVNLNAYTYTYIKFTWAIKSEIYFNEQNFVGECLLYLYI